MASETVNKTFSFAMGRTDGWSLSSSEDEMTLSGIISDGSPAIGCLKTRLSGLRDRKSVV